jgi:crotonobetainyl-CoA:carnitine CoA-transferase CaiB-like acyl-CoA transferase
MMAKPRSGKTGRKSMEKVPEFPAPIARPVAAETALAGIRVVDFSHFIAGPLATMQLADMGADVIKIEKLNGGDDFRRFQPERNGLGAPFLWTNRNKRSVALDLRKPEGRDVALDLIRDADVIVENFSTGVMKEFGLDYETLAADHPALVYCSISAYGREGPHAHRLGFDPVMQAESGFMSVTGYESQEPLRAGPSILDIGTAMMASNAILGAMMARVRLGRGQYVEVALFDVSLLMTGFHAINYLATGNVPTRTGNTSADSAPTGVFHASDGPFYIACANDRTFQRLAMDVLARPDLAENPAYARSANRASNRHELAKILNDLFARVPRRDWLKKMGATGVPAGPVRALNEVYVSDEVIDRGLVTEIAHPVSGSVPNMTSPFRFRDTPVVDPVCAPTVGQHTQEILSGLLAYSEDRIAELRCREVIN